MKCRFKMYFYVILGKCFYICARLSKRRNSPAADSSHCGIEDNESHNVLAKERECKRTNLPTAVFSRPQNPHKYQWTERQTLNMIMEKTPPNT
uniref:Uncharacterized protein n=1 Tax=Arion vulgaris TaxID=1028688 RepID=A0A0B7B9P7_9EUPU